METALPLIGGLALLILGGELFVRGADYQNEVYVLPKHLDEMVARLHLERIGAKLTVLSDEQASYINVPKEGPYKPNHYRY